MEAPHRSPREERRRRLLNNDDALGKVSVDQTETASARRARLETRMSNQRYAKTAQYPEQTRLVDLVPESWVAICLWFLAGLLVIVGLEGLYHWMPRVAHATTDGRVAAFDLDGEGSLAATFSSFQLLMAAAFSLVVYHLRRHRLDDYHGRYRIWIWGAVCWTVMAIDESGSLHEGFKELMVYLTGHRLFGDGSVWWVAAYGLVLSVVGLRLMMDMLEYPVSAATLVLSGVVLVVAVISQLDLFMPESGARGVMVEEGLEMLGNQLLLLALAMHTRFLVRDIKGLNPVWEPAEEDSAEDEGKTTKTRRRRTASKTKADETDDQPTPEPVAKTPVKKAPAKTASTDEDNQEEEPTPRKRGTFLSRLFGGGRDDLEESETEDTPAKSGRSKPPAAEKQPEKQPERRAQKSTSSSEPAQPNQDEEPAPRKQGTFLSRLFGGGRDDIDEPETEDTPANTRAAKSTPASTPAATSSKEPAASNSASSRRVDPAEADERHMTKAERKAARKQKRLERRG